MAMTVCGATGTALAADVVSSTELVEHPDRWDGQEVRFEGEAIGEVMLRGDEAWIHVNDDGYAHGSVEAGADLSGYNSGMPIVIPADEASEISRFGAHTVRGDFVAVTGTFRAASPGRGGEMLIEGVSLDVLEPGGPVSDPVEPWKLAAIAGLSLTCLATWSVLRRRRPAY